MLPTTPKDNFIYGKYTQYHLQQFGWWGDFEGIAISSDDKFPLRLYRPKGVSKSDEERIIKLLQQRKWREAEKLLG